MNCHTVSSVLRIIVIIYNGVLYPKTYLDLTILWSRFPWGCCADVLLLPIKKMNRFVLYAKQIVISVSYSFELHSFSKFREVIIHWKSRDFESSRSSYTTPIYILYFFLFLFQEKNIFPSFMQSCNSNKYQC